jgi:predicted peptidase
MTFNKHLLLASVASVHLFYFCIAGMLFAADKSKKTGDPRFVPGEEVRIDTDNKYIGGDHFLVYVPSDYTDKQDWPVIFYFHGMNGQPNTWLFRQITNGEGFILIGMEYILRGQSKLTKNEYIDYFRRERRSILEVKRYISKYLKIDEKRLFVTGASKGGWHASAILESSAKAWAGAVILAAGRSRNASVITTPYNKRALRGKPIYIGAGEKDGNLASAKKAATYYERLGAEVIFEEYEGAGHAFDHTKPKKLYGWLLANSATDDDKPEQANEDKGAEPMK